MMTILHSESESKCSACGSRLKPQIQNIFDTRFGIENIWQICRCVDCGINQTVPLPLAEDLKYLYETYYNFGGEKETTYTRLRECFFSSVFYRFWLAIDGDISFHSVKGAGRLIDIGCNEGRGLTIYQRNGFEVEGLELNEQAATEARSLGYRIYTSLLEEFQPEDPYDVVVLSNVLEHAMNPKEMLSHVARIMKPHGQVWISCPNLKSWLRYLFGRHWINWHVPFHLFHFSEKTIENLLLSAGFRVSRVGHKTPSLWLVHSIISRFFARRGVPTKQLRNPFLVAPLMLLSRILCFPAMWVGNRLGNGDCLVVVASKTD
jgi:2-polyprenyl-3-methyl-5-hydroxy-6-metoxy-1,4-benzoquinol methylase